MLGTSQSLNIKNIDSTKNYPKSLTILINTRIRGNNKLKYKPSMSIPSLKEKDYDTIYFDPLIRLKQNAVNNIPEGYPETELYSQFFNKNEFDSLLARSTENFSMPRVITLEKATQDGIVNNNIDFTLKQLLKPNSIFYIKGEPFTISSYHWNYGDWKIDTKNFEKTFEMSPHGLGINYSYIENKLKNDENSAMMELSQFKKKYPSFVLQGKEDKYSQFNMDNEPMTNIIPQTLNIINLNPITSNSAVINPQIQQNLPSTVKKLVSKLLVFESPINFYPETMPNLQSDTISLSLIFYSDRNYLKDTRDYIKLKSIYDFCMKILSELNKLNDEYKISIGLEDNTVNKSSINKSLSIFNIKNDYHTQVNIFKDLVEKSYEKNPFTGVNTKIKIEDLYNISSPIYIKLKQEFITIFQKIINLKYTYLISCKNTYILLCDKLKKQDIYIKSFIEFYTLLYSVYLNKLKMATTDEDKNRNYMICKIIASDMNCYTLLRENGEYKEQLSQISFIESITKEFTNNINKIKEINLQEEFSKYYNNYYLLSIENKEYDIYYKKILYLNQKNETIIWKVVENSTFEFFNIIKYNTNNSIENTFILFNKYNSTYTNKEDNKNFFLQLKQDDKPISQKSFLVFSSLNKNKKYLKQKEEYLKLELKKRNCYELITLYSRISTINYARQLSLLTAERNLYYINKNIFLNFEKYYNYIKKSQINISMISEPVFWKNINISQEIDNNKLAIIENGTLLKNIEIKLIDINKLFKNSLNILIPNISSLGILSTCESIVNETGIIENLPTSTNDELFISFFKEFQKNINNDKSFNYYIKILCMTNLPNINNDNKIVIENDVNTWICVNNNSIDSLFISVCNILNGQLITTQTTTLNYYAKTNGDNINNVKNYKNYKFSPLSLRNAIYDYIVNNPQIINKYKQLAISFLKKVSIIPLYNNSNVELINEYLTIKFLLQDVPIERIYGNADNIKFIINDIKIINKNVLNANLYYGDDITIDIFENIFKIKFIIINKLVDKYISIKTINETKKNIIGDIIYYIKNEGDEYVSLGTIISMENLIIQVIDIFDNKKYYFNYDDNSNIFFFDNYTINEFSNSSLSNKEENKNKDIQCAFILKECNDEFIYRYNNIYNYLHNKFIYNINKLPEYFLHLFFRNILWNKLDENPYPSWILFFETLKTDFLKFKKIYNDYNFSTMDLYTNISLNYDGNNIEEKTVEIPIKIDNYFSPPSSTIIQLGGAYNQRNPNQYQRHNNQYHLSKYDQHRNKTSQKFFGNKDSKLTYYVIIDLELYPGDKGIPTTQKIVLGCQTQYEKIRQSWAKLFGQVYRPNELRITRPKSSIDEQKNVNVHTKTIKNKLYNNSKNNTRHHK